MGDTRFGLDVENFDLYFEKLVPLISQPAKEAIPKDVLFKMRRNRLSFLGKLWVLFRCLRKRIWIVVEEEDGGLSVEDFVELREAIKRRDYGISKAEGLVSSGTFITASKELGDTFDYLNRLSTSGAYNFIQRAKNKIQSKTAERNEQMEFICRFLTHYESSRKKIMLSTRIEMAEWLVLIYLYNGKEMPGSPIWKEVYKFSYNSSQTKIKVAYGTLQNRNYIERIGIGKFTKFKITPLGRAAVNEVMDKFVLNC